MMVRMKGLTVRGEDVVVGGGVVVVVVVVGV